MARILVAYGTSHGHTARVVARLAHGLRAAGHDVTVWMAKAPAPALSPDQADAVLIAGSVQFGRHQRYLLQLTRRHAARLNRIPSAFVSVCGALAGTWPEGPREAQGYVDRFLSAAGWRPRLSKSFAGMVAYTQYNPILRWVMKNISRKTGRPTDTSRDWEFTDWEAVDQFAEEFARAAAEQSIPAGVPG